MTLSLGVMVGDKEAVYVWKQLWDVSETCDLIITFIQHYDVHQITFMWAVCLNFKCYRKVSHVIIWYK